jgi:hypothetical protein
MLRGDFSSGISAGWEAAFQSVRITGNGCLHTRTCIAPQMQDEGLCR